MSRGPERATAPIATTAERERREHLAQALLRFCQAPDRASLNHLNIWDCRMLIEFLDAVD